MWRIIEYFNFKEKIMLWIYSEFSINFNSYNIDGLDNFFIYIFQFIMRLMNVRGVILWQYRQKH